jgi:protein-tyrosine phosphatase
MISNGLPTEGYMSAQLTAEDFQGEPLILVMEGKQREKLFEMFPEVDPADVHVLTEYVGDELEITDPYGGSLQLYGLCYETLLSTVRKLANLLDEADDWAKRRSHER